MVRDPDPGVTADDPPAPGRPGAASPVRSPGRATTIDRARVAVAWLAEPPAALRRGPFREGAFSSPLRSTRLTSQLGIALGVAFGICFLTGLISHFIQHPAGWFWWPAGPAQLYRVTQGLHVATGLATVPLLGTKLWAVYPRLFSWPPLPPKAGAALERAGVAVLVAAGLFQVISGTLDVARWYTPMPFFFTAAHYWVAWLAVGAILAHVGVKLPVVRAALTRIRPDASPAEGPGANGELAEGRLADGEDANPELANPELANPELASPELADAELASPELADAGLANPGVADAEPANAGFADAGLGRRELLGAVGVAAGIVTLATVGQTVAPLAPVSLLAPRRPTTGPQRVPVNRTAVGAGVRDAALDPGYALRLTGPGGDRTLTIAGLRALPQHTVVLPISCVEGWSSTGTWTGVRLRDLAELAGVDPEAAAAEVESLQAGSRYRVSTVAAPHLRDPRTLIALRLNGESLAIDHGYPARLIAPNRPGVLQTKWIARITLRGDT